MSNANWPPDARPRSEPEPSGYFPEASETHLRDYWYVILKRRWLILAVLVCVVSYSTARALMRKPVYTASSVLQIDRGKLNLVQDVMTPDYWSGYNEFYPTQQRVLESRNLARRVVQQLRLWEHPYFTGGHKLEADEQTLENLSGAVVGMLQATQIRSTQLMELRFTSLDPKLSADLSNALAQQYIVFHSETVTTLARDTVGFIREQVEKIQKDIQEREKLLQEYSQREDLMMVGEKELIVMRQLEELNTAVTQARTARAVAEADYRSMSAAGASTLPGVQKNPTVQSLLEQRGHAQRNVAELSSKFKDDWPELRRARETLAGLDERVRVEEAAVARNLVAQSRVELNAARERESLLLEEAQSQKREAQALNRLTTNYKQIKAEIDNQRAMLGQLLRRQTETGLSADLGERQPVNVRIVEAALVPRAPTGPGLTRNLFLGTIIGIALSLGLAFFLDYWETSIYTIEDLRRHVQLPYMGMVPRLEAEAFAHWAGGGTSLAHDPNERTSARRGKSLNRTRSALVLSQTTKIASRAKEDTSMIAERFKFLRGSLLLSTPGAPPRTVLVTGSNKNAGKTFVACNLATSLADLDKKILLIDADLRNPQLHKVFRFKNHVGLSNVLSGQTTIEKGCILSSPIPNLYVLLAGPASPTPAELLGSSKMEETLAQCTEHFDYVLLDSAPLLPVFDSHYLTVVADANLLVVRSGHTSRHAVSQSLDLIDRVGGRVTGVVLNDVNLADCAQNYYYSYHSYEYGTYADESVAEERRAG